MNKMLLPILVVVGVSWMVNRAVVSSVKSLLKPEKLLEPVQEIDNPDFIRVKDEFADWVERNGFEYDSVFLTNVVNVPKPIQGAAWWSARDATWALLYVTPNKKNIDFVTLYDDDIVITTASSKDAMMLPQPEKSLIQTFPGLSYKSLYAKHLEARKQVERYESVVLREERRDLMEELKHALKEHARFLMSLPLWQYRGVYWFFIRRNIKVNIPISLDD